MSPPATSTAAVPVSGARRSAAAERVAGAVATPIPGTLNLVLLPLAATGAATCLWVASHAGSWWWVLGAAVVFSYLNNTLFSLLHEATHSSLHSNRRLNDWGGRLAAGFFPTGYTLQRAFHLNHHRNNRSHTEQFDYMRPGDNRFLKHAQWYSIVSGLYWAFVPVGGLLYLVLPASFQRGLLRGKESPLAHQTGADSYLGSVDGAPGWVIRLELVLTIAVQLALVWGLGLSLFGWAICYAAFALNWSSLQYADHAWSPLDVKEGAWNLRVNPITRLLFLNYHHHLAHHQQPSVPWIHLPKFVDHRRPRPWFLGLYLRMWLGPRPIPADHPSSS